MTLNCTAAFLDQPTECFKTSNPNPIPLHGNPILDNFVFKHAAVADDGFCRADIVPVAAHQNFVYAKLFAFVQCEGNHCRCITFAALTRADTVADMAACFQQRFIQIMSNIDSADKDISVFVKAKQRCVRNVSVRIPFLYFKVLKIIIKIVKIIAEYCIGFVRLFSISAFHSVSISNNCSRYCGVSRTSSIFTIKIPPH